MGVTRSPRTTPLRGPGPVNYRVFRPGTATSTPPLVLVHGHGRSAGRLFRAFLPMAMQAGIPLIAPHFPSHTHPRYQQLCGPSGPWGAADDLLAVLSDAASMHVMETSSVDLLGFSGGAQFAHRFSLVAPSRIRRLVLVAAGWYTYLDRATAFPRGIAVDEGAQYLPDPHRFLSIPTHVAVGEEDTHTGGALRHDRRLDLQQGMDRQTRALRWMDHLEEQARDLHTPQRLTFSLLPNTAHSLSSAVKRGGLVELTANHLLMEDPS